MLLTHLAANGQTITYVDLQPPASNGVSGPFFRTASQQAGSVAGRAAIWSGTAGSFVDLQPAAYLSSFAYAISGSQQAGYVYSSATHAALWSGTAGSVLDLHPAGYSSSPTYAIAGNQQAG